MQGGKFCVADFDADGITARVQFSVDLQASFGGGIRDQLDDDLMTDQRPTAPVLGDVGKHTMFDFVPVRRQNRQGVKSESLIR